MLLFLFLCLFIEFSFVMLEIVVFMVVLLIGFIFSIFLGWILVELRFIYEDWCEGGLLVWFSFI